MLKKEVRTQDEEIIEKQKPYSYRERQGKNCRTVPIFIQGETREKQRNKSYTDKVKNKGRTGKHCLYYMQGKTRGRQTNKSHIEKVKNKGRTERYYPYLYKERQGKDREMKAILIYGKTNKS